MVNAVLMLTAISVFVSAGIAQAQPVSHSERCASISGNPDLAIKHCTMAIESGRFSGENLAKLHYNRGVEWAAKSNHDRAIADYDIAIRLNPRNGDAYYNRGGAWGNKGDHDHAIADYDVAIKLNPKDPAAYSSRGFERAAKGEYSHAIADYGTAIRLNPKSAGALLARGRARYYSGDYLNSASDLEQSLKLDHNNYTALWLYLARKRGEVINAEESLDAETLTRRSGAWPQPVILLYMGRTDPASVVAASTDSNLKKQSEQRCEANFYLAQWHLLRGEREHALPLLKEAQSGCTREFLEFEGAVAELRRLQR